MNWLHVYLKLVIDSHVAPLSQQHRQLFTTDLKSVSWMCFSKWLVLTDHYGWRRKRGLVKYMCQNCFSFCFIKKCLGAVFVLTSTSWHLYYIMVHGSFWGCLEQMYQPVQFLNPFFISTLQLTSLYWKKGPLSSWCFKQLQYQQKGPK